MIDRLTGAYIHRDGNRVVIDVQGVGYGVEMPLSSICDLPELGSPITVWVHTYVREDAFRLFGFPSVFDRRAFVILLGLNGVGPKVALAILSTLTVPQMVRAVTFDDTKVFEQVPGVGKRSAEKIIVELRGKVKKLDESCDTSTEIRGATRAADISGHALEDVRSALENLGFKNKDVDRALKGMDQSDQPFADLLRTALVEIKGGSKTESAGPDAKIF